MVAQVTYLEPAETRWVYAIAPHIREAYPTLIVLTTPEAFAEFAHALYRHACRPHRREEPNGET